MPKPVKQAVAIRGRWPYRSHPAPAGRRSAHPACQGIRVGIRPGCCPARRWSPTGRLRWPRTPLGTLLLRLHTETACRRGGALALRPCDVNAEVSTIRLREKGGTTREQPVSPTLADGLLEHARSRPGLGGREQLLRHRDGSPIGRSRYQTLWKRLSQHLPWIGDMGITAHWIRYTTLTWVERNYGYAMAASFAGHAATGYQTSSTMTYVAASVEGAGRGEPRRRTTSLPVMGPPTAGDPPRERVPDLTGGPLAARTAEHPILSSSDHSARPFRLACVVLAVFEAGLCQLVRRRGR